MIAEVIINSMAKDLNKTFDYIVPKDLESSVKIGARIFVPFGKTKKEGYIINLKNKSEFANKEILKIEDNFLTEENIRLAKIMAKRYFCNISDTIKLMLPPGSTTKNINKRVKDKRENFVYLKNSEDIKNLLDSKKIKSEKQRRILEYLKQNEGIHISDLETYTDTSKNIIKTLEKNGYLEILKEKVERNPLKNKNVTRDKALDLSDEQKIAYDKISKSNFKEFLIYGITGSRKNRSIFTIDRKRIKKRKNCNCTCT